MARKKYNYNFVRKPSEGGKEALYMAGASVYVGMKSFKEEQVSHRMSVLGSITSGGMLVAWLALFLIGVR